MPLAAGTRLGPYEIGEPLGAGGMGDVYRARDSRLDRGVAIKIVLGEFSDRFEREARAISALNHPHICTLHDIGSENGINYLVMELVEGETLAARLRKGPLPAEQAASSTARARSGGPRPRTCWILRRVNPVRSPAEDTYGTSTIRKRRE